MTSIYDIPTIDQFELLVNYILNVWLVSNTFFDDIEEPRCLLVLQNLAKKMGITLDVWMIIMNKAQPKWFKDEMQLNKILQGINTDL